MKRAIVFVTAAVAVVVVWALLVAEILAPKANAELRKYLELAEKQTAAGAYGSAVRCYQRVLQIEDTAENRMLLADACKLYGNRSQYLNVLRDAIKAFPDLTEAYERLAEYYYDSMDYPECAEVVRRAGKSGTESRKLSELFYRSAYRYEIEDVRYEKAGNFFNGIAVVIQGNQYYYINHKLNGIGDTGYDFADVYFGSTAGVTKDAVSYFIDQTGAKYLVPGASYRRVFSYTQGRAAVQCDDWYGYINAFGERVLGEYKFASSFSDGIAAVEDANGWRLIDLQGWTVTEKVYEEIKLSEESTVGIGGICFVKKNGRYLMLDSSGKRIGKTDFEDAKPFMEDDLTAVKIDGKWGFVDRSGTVQIEPQYEDAAPFRTGLAAVRVEGAWGFIDEKNVVVIECVFMDAKCFSDRRKAPVQIDGAWTYITLSDKGGS